MRSTRKAKLFETIIFINICLSFYDLLLKCVALRTLRLLRPPKECSKFLSDPLESLLRFVFPQRVSAATNPNYFSSNNYYYHFVWHNNHHLNFKILLYNYFPVANIYYPFYCWRLHNWLGCLNTHKNELSYEYEGLYVKRIRQKEREVFE